LRNRIIQTAFQKGLLLLGAGENSIRLAPPLMIEEEQTEFAVSTLDACITAVEGKK
jgi:4-aminobutyrate aminotransferase